MEINGLANIQMLAYQIRELVRENKSQFGEIGGLAQDITDQAVMLERYLLAYKDAAEEAVDVAAYEEHYQEIKAPFWHEVKAEPNKYPTLSERMNNGK